jgi:hypothetical protein
MSSAFDIPAGWKIEPTELPHVISVTAPTGARWRLLRDNNPDDGPSQCMAALAVAMLDAAPPVDAVPGEPVGEVGKIVMFGGDLKEVSWRNGKMPAVGTKLYAASVASRAGSEPVATDQAVAAPEASRQGEAVAEVNNIGMLKATPHGTRTLKAGDKLYAAPSVLPAQEVDEADFDANLADPPTSQDSAPIAPAAAAEPSEPAHSYALGLATTLWTRYYKAHAPNWEPLEDTLGLLTQIDNMIAGLLPDRERAASLVASEDEKWLDWERELIAAAQAVIERWDTPLWKDAPHTAIFINRMREAIDAARASAGEAQS